MMYASKEQFQSKRWGRIAKEHIDHVAKASSTFLYDLLNQICSEDVSHTIWLQNLSTSLKRKETEAYEAPEKVMRSYRDHLINQSLLH